MAVLTAYSLFLVFRVHSHDAAGRLTDFPLWGLQDPRRLVGWIGELVLSVFWEFAHFAVAGFLVIMVISRGSGRLWRFPAGFRALAAGSALAVLAFAVAIAGSRHPAGMVALMFPLLGCLFGAWAGTTWFRGWRDRLWLVPEVVALALLMVLGTGLVVWLLLEEMPLPFEVPGVTSAEQRRLVDLICGNSPEVLKEGQTRILRLTEHDLNVLLSWGLPFAPQPSFNLCMKTTFALARERSIARNPVVENQAAILALGVLLGHPWLETFIGPVIGDLDKDAAQRIPNRVVLRGRSDCVRHFCVCAALTVLSQETISDAIGLIKEELDADAGGSGFSFADLLANRAGSVFAATATRDASAARTMQNRLAGGFRIEEIFPPADDLRERISDVELQSRYGGVGGEGYRRLVEEIERRIAECAAYK